MWIVLLLICVVVVLAIYKGTNNKSRIENTFDRNPPTNVGFSDENQSYYVSEDSKVIRSYTRKGYTLFSIAGMYYRDLTTADVGKFEGFAEAETDNGYDPYAVAIFSKGKHLGYVLAGNHLLHKHISDKGGMVDAYGFVAYSYNDGYYGEVNILYDDRVN